MDIQERTETFTALQYLVMECLLHADFNLRAAAELLNSRGLEKANYTPNDIRDQERAIARKLKKVNATHDELADEFLHYLFEEFARNDQQ